MGHPDATIGQEMPIGQTDWKLHAIRRAKSGAKVWLLQKVCPKKSKEPSKMTQMKWLDMKCSKLMTSAVVFGQFRCIPLRGVQPGSSGSRGWYANRASNVAPGGETKMAPARKLYTLLFVSVPVPGSSHLLTGGLDPSSRLLGAIRWWDGVLETNRARRRPGPASRSGLWVGCLGFLGLLLVVGLGYGHCSCFVVVAACLCWLWSSSFLLLLLLLLLAVVVVVVVVVVAVKYHAHFPFMSDTHFTYMTYLFGSRQKE